MAFTVTPLIGVDLTKTFSDLTSGDNSNTAHKVGEILHATDGSEWMFVKATTALTLYDTVWINTAGEAAPITPALAITAGRVGFAQVAFTVNYYGWVCLRGPVSIRVAAGCAASVPLYTTDTAGVLDDATTSLSQYQVMGVIASTSVSASISQASANASYPSIRRPAA